MPVWVWGLVAILEFLSWLLGRSKNPQLRSLSAMAAKVLGWLLRRFRVASVPVLGPLVINVLEAVAGRDLDEDGDIADAPSGGTGAPSAPPPLPGQGSPPVR